MGEITLTAFVREQKIAHGTLLQVIEQVKQQCANDESVFIFNDRTGKRLEISFQGDQSEISQRTLAVYPELISQPIEDVTVTKTRGRPKLGVVAKEITLLPRQWEWLATQPGGASATIRRLVDAAKKQSTASDSKRQRLERAYQFMHEVAGNLPDYEACLRALFADNSEDFSRLTTSWPEDIQQYAYQLAFNYVDIENE